MLVESVVSVPHSSDLRFYFPQLKQNIAKSIINPSTTSSIGHLLWGGKDAPEDLIYVEGYTDPASKYNKGNCICMSFALHLLITCQLCFFQTLRVCSS